MLQYLLLSVFLLTLLSGCELGESDGILEKRRPDIVLSELKGKWVLINYWAIWCVPCREEIPELNAVAKQRQDLVVFGYSLDAPPPTKLKMQIKKLGIEFTVLTVEPGIFFDLPPPPVLPTTLLISPDGRLAEILSGPQTRVALNTKIRSMTAKNKQSGQKYPAL